MDSESSGLMGFAREYASAVATLPGGSPTGAAVCGMLRIDSAWPDASACNA